MDHHRTPPSPEERMLEAPRRLVFAESDDPQDTDEPYTPPPSQPKARIDVENDDVDECDDIAEEEESDVDPVNELVEEVDVEEELERLVETAFQTPTLASFEDLRLEIEKDAWLYDAIDELLGYK
eukprot:CFRG2977T1